MIELFAEYIDLELLQLLTEDTYYVHSHFEWGCNLKVSDILSFAGNKDDVKTPYGILLNKKEIPAFIKRVSGGVYEFTWNRRAMQLRADGMVIHLKDARGYSSIISVREQNIPRQSWNLLKNSINLDLLTGFSFTIGEFMTSQKRELGELYALFKSKEEVVIEEVIKRWMGRGPGLTPSGDDFLLGILYIDSIYRILGENFRKSIKKLMQKKYTTDISIHYYNCAFKNRFSYPLIELHQGLLNENSVLIRKSVDKIIGFGSTSGCDTLSGILSGINYFMNTHFV